MPGIHWPHPGRPYAGRIRGNLPSICLQAAFTLSCTDWGTTSAYIGAARLNILWEPPLGPRNACQTMSIETNPSSSNFHSSPRDQTNPLELLDLIGSHCNISFSMTNNMSSMNTFGAVASK